MNFDESLEYLLRLGNEVSAMKLGLENIGKLLAALGDPQKKYLKIQIAGTNGKGSTCAFLESICVAADINVGSTTSPHLVSITERIKVRGEEISETDFARHAVIVRETSERLVNAGELEAVPTFFEQVTAIALNYFAERKVELAILETGLGGRFDATTAARAEIVAITPIDFDHEQILGNSLAEIAAEKAAIIRKDTRVIYAPQKSEAENVIRGKCRESGVEPSWAIPNVKLIEDLGGGLLYLSFSTEKTNYRVDFSMQGKHQWTNAALAIAVAETLRGFDFKIPKGAIETGLETAEHKGRLEFFRPNRNAAPVLFDGAHNVAGAQALRDYLNESVKQPITMIFGAMRDKNLARIGELLFPTAEFLIFTEPDNPRSLKASELVEYLPADFDEKNVRRTTNVADALALAGEISQNNLICVTGSLYLVGEAQKLLNNKSENF